MTVNTLIKILSNFNDDLEVVVVKFEEYQLSEYTWDVDVISRSIESVDINGHNQVEIISD